MLSCQKDILGKFTDMKPFLMYKNGQICWLKVTCSEAWICYGAPKNGDQSICKKCPEMVALRELNVPNTVSSYEDLVRLEVGNGIDTITEFNLLSSKIQGPTNLPEAYAMLQYTTSWLTFYFILGMCPVTLFSSRRNRIIITTFFSNRSWSQI